MEGATAANSLAKPDLNLVIRRGGQRLVLCNYRCVSVRRTESSSRVERITPVFSPAFCLRKQVKALGNSAAPADENALA